MSRVDWRASLFTVSCIIASLFTIKLFFVIYCYPILPTSQIKSRSINGLCLNTRVIIDQGDRPPFCKGSGKVPGGDPEYTTITREALNI
ncbi:hypothetical protein Q3G72_009681 [Acer saccharum]|nr:hypothetical protein Q3G72_009681 [Acer saccharum]